MSRLGPYVFRYRKLLWLSGAFALAVAVLWGGNLSAAFPVVKVLLVGQSLQEYVAEEIVQAEKLSEKDQRRLASIEEEIRTGKAGDTTPEDDAEVGMSLLARKARIQARLTSTSHHLLRFRQLQAHVLPWVPSDRFDTFALLLGVLMLATLVKGGFMYLQDQAVGRVVQLVTLDLRKALFRHTLRLDYQTLSGTGTSELMSRFTYDIDTLATGLLLLGGKVIREPLKAIACVVLAFWVNWQLTLLSLVFVPVALILFNRFGQQLKRASHRSAESMSRIYKVLEETFDAAKVVIAFNGGRRHRRRFHEENKVYYQKSMKIVQIDSLTGPVTEMFGIFAVLVALLPGAYLVLRHTDSIWGIKLASRPMEVAELAVLYALLAGVSDPVRKLSSVYARLKKAFAAADRIFQLFDRLSLIQEPETPLSFPRHQSEIEFRKVTFTYQSGNDPSRNAVLDKVSLKIQAGEVIAVVGENGSGKSTLVNLLPRYYDPEHGAVLIDGRDVRQIRLRDLRAQLGVVTQETLLFDDTILENIRYGNPTATDEDVQRAADKAYVTPFVEQLPEGLQTRVGERGQRLSGGQRQRIALARAILRDPSIFILDEATSAIDAQSEFLIHKALAQFVRGRTTFIITHSVTQSILELVTRIAVLEQGQLIALGTHAELIQSCPAYQRLYRMQLQQNAA